MAVDRTADLEKEFSKSSGGNYFNYVDTAKLERLGITQYKPSLGENAIRIVFPPDRPGVYGLEIFKHSNVGVNRKTFLCKKRMFDERCPVCEYADTLRKDDPQDERAKALNPSRRYLFFVVDVMSDDSIDKGIRWFDCPVGVWNEIKSRSKARRRRGANAGEKFKKIIDVSHPSEGRDIFFEQVKEKGNYSYEGVTLEETEPIPEDWYADLPEFNDILKNSTDEEMEEACTCEPEEDEKQDPKVNDDNSQKVEEDISQETEEEVESAAPPVEEEEKPEAEEGTNRRVSSRRMSRSRESAQEDEQNMKDKVKSRLARARAARSGGEE